MSQGLVARLYELDSRGIVDDELLDKVGWMLCSRAADVLLVSRQMVRCPVCAAEFAVRWGIGEDDVTHACPQCGWATTGPDYHRSWQKQDLNGHSPALQGYVVSFRVRRPRRSACGSSTDFSTQCTWRCEAELAGTSPAI